MGRDETRRHARTLIRRLLPAEDIRTFNAVRRLVERGDEVWVVVTGASMRPTLEPGDRVLLASTAHGFNVGDIVLADLHGRPCLHRIVGRRANVLSTLGDNCLRPDPPIRLADVVARAEAVHSARGTSALRVTARFGLVALARFIGIEARVRARRLWRRARYADSSGVSRGAIG